MRMKVSPAVQGRRAVVRHSGLEALGLKRLAQHLGDVRVVVDDQHADLLARFRCARRDGDGLTGGGTHDGKLDGECRAESTTFAMHADRAAVSFYEIADDRQAEAEAAEIGR